MRRWICGLTLGLIAGVCAEAPASSLGQSLLGEGALLIQQGGKLVRFPLKRTTVQIKVAGPIAEATVQQEFENPYPDKIEAVYVFPLPTAAALRGYQLRNGSRLVQGRLLPRPQAALVYHKAREAGRMAALLEEERPNLFTQTIANLEPGGSVLVTLRYVQTVPHQAGEYELVFPMVVGPRFQPGPAAGKPAPPSPPVLPPALRSAHQIELAVKLLGAMPLSAISSPSHRLRISRPDPASARVSLAAADTIPNRDFILRYRMAGALPRVAVLTRRAEANRGGHLLLMLQPPDPQAAAPALPREVIFVLDTSSSMAGAPLQQAKTLVRHLLDRLRPDDTFQLVRFDERALSLGPAMISSKSSNREVALSWLERMQAAGGTFMAAGLRTALALPHDPGRLRLLVFLSDGYIGNEPEVLATLAKELGPARIFPFGIGSAVNRYLLEEMALLGRGELQVLRPDEPAAPAVARFQQRTSHPVLSDLRLQVSGLRLSELTPARLPDLFLGQPLYLQARFEGAGPGRVVVTGRRGGKLVRLEAALLVPAGAHDPGPLDLFWARARIAEEERRLIQKDDPAIKQRILELSLQHSVLTRFTAFVAVDEDSRSSGKALRVEVPVERPQGLLRGASGGLGGAGGLALMGYGSGGGGILLRASRAVSAPRVVMASSVVLRGALDKELIRRVVRQHLNQVRHCYEQELGTQPQLTGRMTVQLVIEAGSVRAASISEATLKSPALESCLLGAVRGWIFPTASDGGVVVVSYPFVFRPAQRQRSR